MGLSNTGSSCFDIARVAGYSLLPLPPASTIPLIEDPVGTWGSYPGAARMRKRSCGLGAQCSAGVRSLAQASDSMQFTRREALGVGFAGVAISCDSRGRAAVATEVLRRFTPEMFGAKGDGVANDTPAFVRLAAAVNQSRGGLIELRSRTYVVGMQTTHADGQERYSYYPSPILALKNCNLPLIIRGHGARMVCASGLRYGVFDQAGAPRQHEMPYFGSGLATPYSAMVRIEGCSGIVQIDDLELDGNLQNLRIGSQYGDTGWQLPAVGLALLDNSGAEILAGIYTHHHGQDGLYVDGQDMPSEVERRVLGLHADHNARQGCSVVGGRGYRFEHCRFTRTGKANLYSAPGAGVDLEAEGKKTNRDIAFVACEFSDNRGCGMIADNGDTSDVHFEGCSFVGTTTWSAWPNRPSIQFKKCEFLGAIANAYGDANPDLATSFTECTFRDDPRHSPTREVFGATLADLSTSQNVAFDRCTFLATDQAVIPWSTRARYVNCRMQQKSTRTAYPRGLFIGENIIQAPVDLHGSHNEGTLIVNGHLILEKEL